MRRSMNWVGAGVFAVMIAAACMDSRAAQQAPAAEKFDSSKAFEHLRQIVGQGPRPSGSAALRQTRAYITRQISAMGLTVQEQAWTAATPRTGKTEMVNLVVRLPGPATALGVVLG